MSPENALIARLGKAISPHAAAFNVALTDKKARAALKALGIPLPVLAWCAANPEAAKGLAEGTMVAVPKEPTDAMKDALLKSAGYPIERDPPGFYHKFIKDDPAMRYTLNTAWPILLAASTPAPSAEAQGETT